MLLRRITQHVKDQNWTAIGIDFVIVVLGVFIGIQVANWNDAQLAKQEERDILERLHDDLMAREESRAAIIAEERLIRDDLYNTRLVLLGVADMRPFTLQECAAIVRSNAPLVPEVNIAIIDELVATGRLDLISDPEIRSGASALHQLQNERRNLFETYLRDGEILVRRYPELLPYSLEVTEDPADEDGYAPTFRCDSSAMIKNRAFINDFAQNVSINATAGNVTRGNSELISAVHASLDRALGITHEQSN